MSFLEFGNETIKYGDTAIIYLNPKSIFVQKVEQGKVFQTKFGAMKHDSIVGQLYGSKFQCTKGYVYLLKATPELWTICLPHRTQILYFPDISLITTFLELRPGSLVVEAGTGSGSMTHSLARTIAPTGHVYTFDFHEVRSLEARKEFEDHGLGHIVTTAHRDVCESGFPEELDNRANGLFLDLPHPWECIPKAKKVLKKGGRICCFSPCIEQVQKSCLALSENQFLDVCTYECVLKPYEIRNLDMKLLDFGDNNKCVMQEQETNDAESSENGSCIEEDESSVRKKGESDHVTKGEKKVKSYYAAFPSLSMAGHTGFLSFATKSF